MSEESRVLKAFRLGLIKKLIDYINKSYRNFDILCWSVYLMKWEFILHR